MVQGRRGTGGGPPTAALDELTSRVVGRPGLRAAASVDVSLGKLGKWCDRQMSRDELMRQIVPVLITGPQIPLAGGAGTLAEPDLFGPHDGYAWDVRRLTVQSFSAGSVAVYNSFQADENLLWNFTAAGVQLFSSQVILGDTDALFFVATGITGQVTISGQAIQVPTPLLPEYLL